MSKEEFKSFARLHPELVRSVNEGKTSWQKLYEIYDIYGENNTIWDDYFQKPIEETTNTIKTLFNTFRNLDMESVQKGITNIQKTISLLQDIGIGSNKETTTNNYEPRPLYQYFED